jgi:hypothetical protein
MTREEVEDYFEQITGHSIYGGDGDEGRLMYLSPNEVHDFASVITSAERESCAKLCDETRWSGYVPPEDGAAATYYDDAATNCAEAIRARGKA